ncbi:MAG TPA: OmpA family protein [Acidisarcina sp.]
MTKNHRNSPVSRSLVRAFVPVVAVLAILSTEGCKKKTSAPMPPSAPTITGPAPTAQLTANPTVVNPGDQVTLNWHTTDATDVTIEGIGAVPTSGTRSVTPAESTSYQLTARGDGGTADASVRVTVTAAAAGTPAPASDISSSDMSIDDSAFHQNVQDIFYDYDSYEVNAESQAIISKDAAFLAAHPKLKILVGGYCDERGSTEYNIALGENRANSAKVALIAAGVAPDRVRTVSYGKEKQFCSDHAESCWQQNRRAQFAVDR